MTSIKSFYINCQKRDLRYKKLGPEITRMIVKIFRKSWPEHDPNMFGSARVMFGLILKSIYRAARTCSGHAVGREGRARTKVELLCA